MKNRNKREGTRGRRKIRKRKEGREKGVGIEGRGGGRKL